MDFLLYLYLQYHPKARRLTKQELAAGWHYCDEFDCLLTEGEIMNEDGTCLCGFDKREYE